MSCEKYVQQGKCLKTTLSLGATMKILKSIALFSLSFLLTLPAHATELADESDKLSYIATFPDLIRAFGANAEAGANHYENAGHTERRYMADLFDPVEYLILNADVAQQCGYNSTTANEPTVQACGARHYINYGFREGRSWSDLTALSYIASYPDLIRAFGADADAGRKHYLDFGKREGRSISFNIVSHVQNSGAAKYYRSLLELALEDYINFGPGMNPK